MMRSQWISSSWRRVRRSLKGEVGSHHVGPTSSHEPVEWVGAYPVHFNKPSFIISLHALSLFPISIDYILTL